MKKTFALLLALSFFGGSMAMEQAANPEALRAAQEQAAQNVQRIIDRSGGNNEVLKLNLVGRIKQLGGEVFGENVKSSLSGFCINFGSIFLQTVLVYEIIFAGLALYSCFYGVGSLASYLLVGHNVLSACGPMELFQLAHSFYLSALSTVTEIGVLAGAFASVPLLVNKVYGRLFVRQASQAERDAAKIVEQVAAEPTPAIPAEHVAAQ